ncbi:MAG: RNA polymerase sigma factor [Phaeodactylibacter sp.]|nr:RNA polymerase sigma factor [Phaeodactylibacter sp.]
MKKSQSDEQERSDLEIWNLFRSGEESAFEFIYQKYFDKLYNYGCQFTRDHSLVEDVLQELFIELRRRRAHLSATNKIQPYLYSAFRRKMIRYRDKRSRFKELDAQQSFPIAPNIEESIIEDEIKREHLMRLQKAIESLSERHREIIFLFFYEDLTYEEIREIQDFENIKSARNLLYKALKSLRKKIEVLLFLIGILPVVIQWAQFLKKII